MAEKDKGDQRKPPVESSKDSSPDDFEKTQLDIKVKDVDRVLDETMIFHRPKLEEEDTDLHRLKRLKEIEQAQKDEASKALVQKKTASVGEPSQDSKESAPSAASEAKGSRESKQVKKEETVFPESSEAPEVRPLSLQDKLWKGLEFSIGLILLLLLLDASIEGLMAGSPFSKFTVAATIVSVATGLAFIFKKGNFHVGVETAAGVVLVLLAYAAWNYGSADPKILSVLKRPPSQLYNLIFLSVYGLALTTLFFRGGGPRLMKMILGGLTVYASAGILENLLRGLSFPKAWNLEDSLFGSPLWGWMPIPYLRPTLFGFWALIPLLILYFLIARRPSVDAEGRPVSSGALRNGFVAFVLLLSLGLAHVLLFNQRIPSLIGFLKRAPLGVGEARVLKIEDRVEDYDVRVETSNALSERTSDLATIYRLAAAFQDSADGKRNVLLTVRGEGGRAVPFLKGSDLSLVQEGVPQKAVRLKFKEDELLKARSVAVLLDRSSPMGAVLPYADGAIRDVFDFTQSKERFLLLSFADDAKATWVKGKEDLKKLLSGVFSQGGRNLAGALEATAKSFKSSSEPKLILLITGTDAALPADALAKLSQQLKTLKARLYVFSFGEGAPLKALAEGSGGKSVAIQKPLSLSGALRGAFAQTFGEYQISYEGVSFAPKLELSAPAADSEISQDTPVTLRVLNPSEVKVKSARLYVDGKIAEEAPVQGPEVKFNLNPSKFAAGSHRFKPTVVLEDGKEYGQEIRLSVAAGLEFRLIRPLEGDVVSGPLNLEVFFRSAGSVLSRVDFLVDGQKIGEASSEPYLFTWDASTQTGVHTLQAVGAFSDGSTKTDQAKVNVMPGFVVKMISPSVGEFLSSTEILEADVAHPLSDLITKVEFLADGAPVGEVTQAPYKYSWDNSEIGGGKHVIQARAFSSSNLTATDAVTVNIGSGTFAVPLSTSGGPGGAFLSPDYMEFVIDASNSMNRPIAGGKKIDFIRQALIDMLPKIPAQTQVGVRVFGSESPASLKDCNDTVLSFPPKAVDSTRIVSLLNLLEAKGVTPLARVLERIRADLKSSLGSRVVVLFTDGYEDCGGDPVGQLEKWKKEKFSTKLYVVGLDLEGTRAETELKRLTALMGGQYFSVKNEKEIFSALEEMVKVTFRVLDHKGRAVLQKPVGSPAAPLRTGEYRVEVDLDPPLVKEKVVIQQGVDKKVLLKKNGINFSLEEQ